MPVITRQQARRARQAEQALQAEEGQQPQQEQQAQQAQQEHVLSRTNLIDLPAEIIQEIAYYLSSEEDQSEVGYSPDFSDVDCGRISVDAFPSKYGPWDMTVMPCCRWSDPRVEEGQRRIPVLNGCGMSSFINGKGGRGRFSCVTIGQRRRSRCLRRFAPAMSEFSHVLQEALLKYLQRSTYFSVPRAHCGSRRRPAIGHHQVLSQSHKPQNLVVAPSICTTLEPLAESDCAAIHGSTSPSPASNLPPFRLFKRGPDRAVYSGAAFSILSPATFARQANRRLFDRLRKFQSRARSQSGDVLPATRYSVGIDEISRPPIVSPWIRLPRL
jgi:hypothetical protein